MGNHRIGERIIHSEDEPDQIGKGEGLVGDSDCHYIPGLPIEHPMTVCPFDSGEFLSLCMATLGYSTGRQSNVS